MSRVPGSFRSALTGCLLFVGIMLANPAPAAAESTTITSTIAPVRTVIVDDSGTILEIQSNTATDVRPVVYKDRAESIPTALTPGIYHRYESIMRHADNHKTGVIYRKAEDRALTKRVGLSHGLLKLGSYESILAIFSE